MRAVSKPIRQLSAVALLVAALGAAFVLLVDPALRHSADARQRIAEQRELLGRFQAAAARSGEAESLQRSAEAAPLSRLMLKGETEAIQLAGLQSMIGEAASRHGVRVTSARPLPAADSQGIRLVGLRLDVRADLATIQALLHRIETMEPTLIVQGLQIRGAAVGGSRADQPAGNAVLEVSISVYGAQPPRKG